MKVFISHKNEDSAQAVVLQNAFAKNGVTSYLDVLDSSINSGGKALTDHIKENLNTCTDIIVIMTENTKYSWWVPFEIGMSAQVDLPTASFLKSDVVLPSYLSYWPRLKTTADVDKYVAVRKQIERQMQQQGRYELSERRATETREFYAALKKELR
ncbi:Domain of unknown function DUF1863 [Desulfitobacterium hafniense DCB-2]|uniref:TIR domain-containing protein n=1 Tax=Desulfitobacterium hafniense (strain DSM 10664 / DCB-2) TaxID=272564 RepID=B8FXQ6_DESHD|nr:TIR domain-containing protein [Desulfitobacterium hafniense]ACL22657.1 Domain of unknown function DUF1863 [Desulfitobacterium hafniense DCB-2]